MTDTEVTDSINRFFLNAMADIALGKHIEKHLNQVQLGIDLLNERITLFKQTDDYARSKDLSQLCYHLYFLRDLIWRAMEEESKKSKGCSSSK